MALEVEAKSRSKPFTTETCAELLEDCAPLSVGDPIEVEEGLIGIEHTPRDRMCGWRIIFAERPSLQLHIEVTPRIRVRCTLRQAEVRHVGGE